jgi:hypothetical protein
VNVRARRQEQRRAHASSCRRSLDDRGFQQPRDRRTWLHGIGAACQNDVTCTLQGRVLPLCQQAEHAAAQPNAAVSFGVAVAGVHI